MSPAPLPPQWLDEMCSPQFESPQFESHGPHTQRQLKESLYDTIIDYFDKGKVGKVCKKKKMFLKDASVLIRPSGPSLVYF